MSDSDFKDKIRSLQFPRSPHVEQKDVNGSTQTYHTTGRVDADVHLPVVECASLANDDQ